MFLFHLTPEDILYLFSGAVALLATAPGIAVSLSAPQLLAPRRST